MTIHMDLGPDSYDILIECGILSKAGQHLNLNRRVLVVTDTGGGVVVLLVDEEDTGGVVIISLLVVVLSGEDGVFVDGVESSDHPVGSNAIQPYSGKYTSTQA